MARHKFALFTYDFPHLRTQEFMQRLHILGHECIVYAAPWRELPIAPQSERIFLRRQSLLQPETIARAYGWIYNVAEHNDLADPLSGLTLDPKGADYMGFFYFGIIAGARILSEELIALFGEGIINFHTGLLPLLRGLDTPLWAIMDNQPPYITAHWIDSQTDAGRFICTQQVPLYPDDTLVDFNERLFEMQLSLLDVVTAQISRRPMRDFPPIDITGHIVHHKMAPGKEAQARSMFPAWRDRWISAGHVKDEVRLWLA